MFNKLVIASLGMLLISTSYAGGFGGGLTAEERWSAMPQEKKEIIIQKAADRGFDVTTPEGRESFHAARKEQRQATREAIKSLSTEDRQALRTEMAGLTRSERRALLQERFQTATP